MYILKTSHVGHARSVKTVSRHTRVHNGRKDTGYDSLAALLAMYCGPNAAVWEGRTGCVAHVSVRWSARFSSLCRLTFFFCTNQLVCSSHFHPSFVASVVVRQSRLVCVLLSCGCGCPDSLWFEAIWVVTNLPSDFGKPSKRRRPSRVSLSQSFCALG